jgi:hypothetical protein
MKILDRFFARTPPPKTTDQIATLIEGFANGTGGRWDWDYFISTHFGDERVNWAQNECFKVEQEFPRTGPVGWCNETEPWDEMERSPKDLGNSLEWAGDSGSRNIVVLAEEVASEIARPSVPLHGWGLVMDKLQLVGCGILLIVLIAAVIAGVQALFGWK